MITNSSEDIKYERQANIKTNKKSWKDYGGCATHPEHDCYDWRTEVWCNQANATYLKCAVCNRIIGFRYKSFWNRLADLFSRRVTKRK